MFCAKKGCMLRPKVRLLAIVFESPEHSLRVLPDKVPICCNRHAALFQVQFFLDPKVVEGLKAQVAREGHPEPDMKTAKFVWRQLKEDRN